MPTRGQTPASAEMTDHLLRGDAEGGRSRRTASSDGFTPKTRACTHCAKLKMKCQWPATGTARPESTCVRCGRMKLACRVPEATIRKKRGKSTRVAQLEEKIEGIVSLLASQQAQSGHMPLTPNSIDRNTTSSTSPRDHRSTNDYTITSVNRILTGNSTTGIGISSAESQHPSTTNDELPPRINEGDIAADMSYFELFPGFRVTSQDAITYLETYRNEYVPKFPFVVFPSSMDPRELWSSSRCLFWSVMGVVVPHNFQMQDQFKKWFRTFVAEAVVVEREKRVDILQAILIHISWGDFHFYLDSQATALFQLALGLVLDLKLDRPPHVSNMLPRSLIGDAWSTLNRGQIKKRSPHTLSDKRALLGLYHVTNLAGSLFRAVHKLPWNSYLASCCDALVQAREYDSDLYIVSVVRMQQIADRAYEMQPWPDVEQPAGNGSGGGSGSAFPASLDMALACTHRELAEFADAQPEVVKQNRLFWPIHHVLLVRLYEPTISIRTSTSTASTSSSTSTSPFQRSESLWKCLQSCADYFTAHLEVPPSSIPSVPFTYTTVLSFVIVTSTRLLLLENSPEWQPSIARRRFDFADYMQRISDQCERADAWAMETSHRRRMLWDGGSIFYKYCFKLRWVRQWYLARMPQEQPPHGVEGMAPAAAPAEGLSTSGDAVPSGPSGSGDTGGMPSMAAAAGLNQMPVPDMTFHESFWEELLSMPMNDPNLFIPPQQ